MLQHSYTIKLYKYIVEHIKDPVPKEVTNTHVRLKVTTCLYLRPKNSARSLSTHVAVNVYKDTKYNTLAMIKAAPNT